MDIPDIWTPAAFVFGAQITFMHWRIQRELSMEENDAVTWLPPCDYLNLLSMLCTVGLVFCVPILDLRLFNVEPSVLALRAFGASAIFLVGYLFAVAGHYRLFIGGHGPRPWRTAQETAALIATLSAIAVYVAYFAMH